MFLKVSAGTPKLSARMSGCVCAIQSVKSSVLNSDALPSSKHRMNSQPSSPMPCSECGRPAGKYHRPPWCTSSTLARPFASMVVMRQEPAVTMAHSAKRCQCSSRMPPRVRRMLTPAISSEICEVGLRDLARPAAVLDAARRVVERRPEHRQVADVGGGRRERAGELPRQRRIVGAGHRWCSRDC